MILNRMFPRTPWGRGCLVAFAVLALAAALRPRASARAAGAGTAADALQVYFVDVEGGQATLFVTPDRHSLLIDTGWPGGGRDADRIVVAARQAGLSRLDYVLITHFHQDHVGGVPQLVERIPVGTFIDHGPNREPGDADTERVWQAYERVLAQRRSKRIVAKPGEVLPIPGMRVTVVSADGNLIDRPLPGGGEPNPACRTTEPRAADRTENARSLGTMIEFGKLKMLDLGDLTWDKEMQLVCPDNKLGKVDVYIVSHHGWYQSGSPALVDAIAPRVAIMNNGATKGGSPSAWQIIEKSPRLEALWQLHYSEEGGAAHNVAAPYIANTAGPDAGHYLKLTAWPNGVFEVFNSRTQATKRYGDRPSATR